METAAPTTGAPRGIINRMASLGLPPWAAWTRNLDAHAMYRLSGSALTSFVPKYPHLLDGIWGNERVRERVMSQRDRQYCVRELKYPYMRTGVWFSDALDHWVQVPHVRGAQFDIEREGGFDNFVLRRPGHELRSIYGERLRRHILVRQREIEKNHALQRGAERLAAHVLELTADAAAAAAGTAKQRQQGDSAGDSAAAAEALDAVFGKYGMDRRQVVAQATKLREQASA